MTNFTISSLKDMMRKTADGTGPELGEDFLDTPFPDLEFDSLSVLELATRVQREYDLAIPDEALDGLDTPRDFLDYVTLRLGETV